MTKKQFDISPLKIVLPATLIFFIVSAIGIYNHELWLDEAQHFLIGRDSDSLTSMYYNMQYDGHVRLWNYCLFFITHYISATPFAMQTFHLLIITATVFIFLRFAPFDILTKLLIISGYFFLFEYNVISRNYALGILFLFACCRLLANEKKNVWWIGLMLVLMSNTHLFFAFAACGIFLYVFVHKLKRKNFDKHFFIFSFLFLLAILSVAVQIKIPSDRTYFHPEQMTWYTWDNISKAFYGLAKGFLPLPLSINGDFWNHFIFNKFPSLLQFFLALWLVIYPFLLLRRAKPAMLFFFCSIFLLFSFLLLSQSWAARYFGMAFIFFIASAWLAGNESINIFSIEKIQQTFLGSKLFYGFFYLLLACHIFSGAYSYITDLSRPFTEAKNVVDYIKSNQANKKVIVMDGYGAGPAVSAYLGRPVFYLNIDQNGSYCYWKKSWFEFSMGPLVAQLQKSIYANGQDSFLLVSIRDVKEKQIQSDNSIFHFRELSNFKNGIIKPDYYIYEVTRTKPDFVATNK